MYPPELNSTQLNWKYYFTQISCAIPVFFPIYKLLYAFLWTLSIYVSIVFIFVESLYMFHSHKPGQQLFCWTEGRAHQFVMIIQWVGKGAEQAKWLPSLTGYIDVSNDFFSAAIHSQRILSYSTRRIRSAILSYFTYFLYSS